MKNIWLVSLIFIAITMTVSCKYYRSHAFRKTYSDFNTAVHNADSTVHFMKVHLKNGNVAVLDDWKQNASQDTINGKGQMYDFNRMLIANGKQKIALNDVAIIETNDYSKIKSKDSGRIGALAVLTTVNVVGGIICLTVPKACFGSCPTFYTPGHNDLFSSSAEGFSSSIAPSLAEGDYDALGERITPGNYSLTLKNEAWETHVIDDVTLFGVPVNKGEKAYRNFDGSYAVTNNPSLAIGASVGNEDVLSEIKLIDNEEYYSLTDSTDLSSREEIILNFPGSNIHDAALVINFRQTLLTTFLLYNGLSYMGDEVGDYLAKIETDQRVRKMLKSPFDVLGKIDIRVWNEKHQSWEKVTELYETGPIAKNLQLVDLPEFRNEDGSVKIKIISAKGMWRYDHFSLVNIVKKTAAVEIPMTQVKCKNIENKEVLDLLAAVDEKPLITFPSDEFLLEFETPETTGEFELFLYSHGYYLEWMREEWMPNKNTDKLRRLLLTDKETWRDLAVEFKAAESEMEATFWNSKYPTAQ